MSMLPSKTGVIVCLKCTCCTRWKLSGNRACGAKQKWVAFSVLQMNVIPSCMYNKSLAVCLSVCLSEVSSWSTESGQQEKSSPTYTAPPNMRLRSALHLFPTTPVEALYSDRSSNAASFSWALSFAMSSGPQSSCLAGELIHKSHRNSLARTTGPEQPPIRRDLENDNWSPTYPVRRLFGDPPALQSCAVKKLKGASRPVREVRLDLLPRPLRITPPLQLD